MLEWARRRGDQRKEAETLLNRIVPFLTGHEVDKALKCAREAYTIAVILADGHLIARSTGAIGSALCVRGDLGEAHDYLQTAVAAGRTYGIRDILGEILVYCLMERNWVGDFRGALALADEALAVAEEFHNPSMAVGARLISVWAWCGLGEYQTALELLTQADDLAIKARITVAPAELLNTRGWIYQEVYDLQRSLKFNREGLGFARVHGEIESEANALTNLGVDPPVAGRS